MPHTYIHVIIHQTGLACTGDWKEALKEARAKTAPNSDTFIVTNSNPTDHVKLDINYPIATNSPELEPPKYAEEPLVNSTAYTRRDDDETRHSPPSGKPTPQTEEKKNESVWT
jgi:hypothetical protein